MAATSRRFSIAALVVLAAIAGTLVAFRTHVTRGCCHRGDATATDESIVSELPYTMDSLPNGLRYYVLAHATPRDRAELRLVVDAGSLEEDGDQRGLAHAVEHMVFRGTRSFPDRAIDRYFESIGMRRGDDVNAETGLDDTQYRMTVPTTRAGALDTALAMLASIAHEATFDTADARRESGVLLAEWGWSRGTDGHVLDARRPLLYAGTRYAARPVTGDTNVLARLDVRAMRRFYDAWYRPELMTVIAVGDFDAKEIEGLIRRRFSSIASRPPRVRRPVVPRSVSSDARDRVAIVADPQAQSSSISVWHPRPGSRYRTLSEYRAALIASLWRDVLRGRLEEAALRPGGALADAGVDHRPLARFIASDVVTVTAMRGRTLAALQTTVGEMRELARTGPTAAELDECGRAFLRQLHEQAQDGDGSAALAGELIDHFLTGDPPFTSRTSYELAREALPTITLRDVRGFARTQSPDSGAVFVLDVAADDPAAGASTDSILARVRSTRADVASDAGPQVGVRQLLENESPMAGRIVHEQAIPEVHAYEWTLSNGMRVLLKPTSFTFDDVELRAVAPGGASLAPDSAYASAWLSDVIVDETGVGRIPAPRLRRWLSGSSISLAPTVSDDAVEFDGSTATADLEPFFKLLYLYLTSPRSDTVAFRRYQERAVSMDRDGGRDPDAVFSDSLDAAFDVGDPRAIKHGASFVGHARLDEALDFWRRRTVNGAGFVVALAGDFTLDRVRPLVERYLASIPRGTAEQPAERSVRSGSRLVRHDFTMAGVSRVRSAIGFRLPLTLSTASLNALYAVRDVASTALTERLRDRLGGTYDVDVSVAVDVVPPSRYTLTARFESSPSRARDLADAASEVLARLHRDGPTEAEFLSAREARQRDIDAELRDNSYWTAELTSHARNGWPLAGIAAHRREAEAMTRDALRRACARFIPAPPYVRVTMRPAVSAAPGRRQR